MSAKRSGLVKQLINQCCFAVVDVCDDGDIAQSIYGKRHNKLPGAQNNKEGRPHYRGSDHANDENCLLGILALPEY